MSKEDFIQDEGVVSESLPNATFRVEVAGQTDLILCHLSGKMRKNFIRVLPGDRVIFEMSPYDLTKGRIIRRLKPGETRAVDQPTPQVEVAPEPTAEPTTKPIEEAANDQAKPTDKDQT